MQPATNSHLITNIGRPLTAAVSSWLGGSLIIIALVLVLVLLISNGGAG